jgi:hypothetical protein
VLEATCFVLSDLVEGVQQIITTSNGLEKVLVVNGPRFDGKVLQLYKGQLKRVQLGRYQLNGTVRARYCQGDECESVAKARVKVLSHRVDWQVEGVVRRGYAMTPGLMIGQPLYWHLWKVLYRGKNACSMQASRWPPLALGHLALGNLAPSRLWHLLALGNLSPLAISPLATSRP